MKVTLGRLDPAALFSGAQIAALFQSIAREQTLMIKADPHVIRAGTIWRAADGTTVEWLRDMGAGSVLHVASLLLNGEAPAPGQKFPILTFFKDYVLSASPAALRDDVTVTLP